MGSKRSKNILFDTLFKIFAPDECRVIYTYIYIYIHIYIYIYIYWALGFPGVLGRNGLDKWMNEWMKG